MLYSAISKRTLSYTATVLNKPKLTPSFLSSKSSGSNQFAPQSGPPKLPDDEQEEFERLQKIANSQSAIDEYNESVSGSESAKSSQPNLKNDIGGFSPEYFKTIPEFDGDTNPKTGEVGGPKQEPLKHGDWSFNGRVTDF